MSVDQSAFGRQSVRIVGRSAEPTVSVKALTDAISPEDIEAFRPLLPVGYQAGVQAYQAAVSKLTAIDLTTHYTKGLEWFHEAFVPRLKVQLTTLSGGIWDLSEFVGIAAGSDVDLMTHLVGAVAQNDPVWLYPGDWYGFQSGVVNRTNIRWAAELQSLERGLACLCVPSVRNGHMTQEMLTFLGTAPSCLLNLNLYPTLLPEERKSVAKSLLMGLEKSILSISFSRGFGLTASQLGVALIHRNHPYRQRFGEQWNWLTYFYNALGARAFLQMNLDDTQVVDASRREWVGAWLLDRGLPAVSSGSYYVKSFQPVGSLPEWFTPILRDGIVRLCFKPPQT